MADQEMQRLEDALRGAADAGDNVAATRIAEAIRNRRAMGGQDTQTSPLKTEPAPDPFATVPTEIDGFALPDDLRQQILDGRAIEDPKEKRLAAARIAGRIAAMDDSGNFADKVARGQFGAGLRGFGAGIFGLGDVAAAAGTALQGIGDEKAMSFGEALEAQREFRRALEEEFPVTSLVGEVAGAVTGGALAVKGIATLAKGAGKAPALVRAATQLQKGQGLKNTARLAAGGAAAGAITEGVTEGEAQKGAILGLAAGPLGVGLLKAGEITKLGITKLLEDPAAAGIKAMAKKMGVKADEMARRFLEFKTVTGKNPTMADLANNEAAVELRQMIVNQPAAASAAREGAEAVLETRGVDVAEQLAGGRVTTTRATQEARRTAVAEEAFAKAERDPIKFTRGQVQDLLNDPDLRRGIPRTLKRRLDDIMDAAGDGPVTLTGLDVNDMRKALRKRARGATGADRVFGELADEVEQIARGQSQKFGEAIDEFARRSLTGEGVAAGRKIATTTTGEVTQAGKAAGAAEAAGRRVGARTAVAETAAESAASADRLVKTLAEEGGLVERLRTVLPEAELTRIRDIAKLQVRSGQNISTLAPAARAQVDRELRDAVSDAVGGIVAATGGAGAGFKSNVIVRLISRILPGGNPKIIENMARDLFDPSKTKQVLAAMRRAEISDEAILDLYAKVAVSSGAAAAAVVN